MTKRPIAYYITAHGYGHGVRSCDIIRALKIFEPERPLLIISDLGERFFRIRLGPALKGHNSIRQAAFDVGMVQKDSIRTDVDATLERMLAICSRAKTLIDDEVTFLRNRDAALVVTDIPGIPLEAAARAGIPGVAVGNFSWDWIYAPFIERDARWAQVVDHFRDWYAKADLLLRLPFSADMSAFRRREDMPLLASPGKSRREELARQFGADIERRWVLLSFTALSWERTALERLSRLSAYEFFGIKPFDCPESCVHTIDPKEYPSKDAIASVDVVLSKPGFGIVSECIVNRKPLIYADRSDFIEYPVLVNGIQRYLRQLHIPSDRLYAGDLEQFLDNIWRQADPPDVLQSGGAEIAASRILSCARD